MTDLSVIIVTRNTCESTCAAIRSALAAPGGFSREIIVVDNGSNDATPEAVRAGFPSVQYIRSESNLGFARANNLAARSAQGEFLALLNSDARLPADALSTALLWMRANGKCGIAGGQLLNPDGSRQNSIANFPSLATELLNKSLLRRLFPKRYPGKETRFSGPVEVESIIGAFFLVRRSVWDELGGLDERYFFFFEETDFCLRARRRGWKVFHLPQVQVWHEQGRSARQWSAGARIEYWRSRYEYFRKNHGRSARLALRLGLGLRLSVDLAGALLVAVVTLGHRFKWRNKLATYWALARWHLRGCPPNAGLPR